MLAARRTVCVRVDRYGANSIRIQSGSDAPSSPGPPTPRPLRDLDVSSDCRNGLWSTGTNNQCHPRSIPRPNSRPVGTGLCFLPLSKVLEFRRRGWTVFPWVTVVTFDDGFQGVYRHAWPVLQEFNIPAEERDQVSQQIRASGARLTFVGLGCPRQEVWAYEFRQSLKMPLLAVGAAFNFHAGLLPQAPHLMQRSGFEWLFRLVSEPRRLWKRYLLLNPAYLTLLAFQFVGLSKIDAARVVKPDHEILYG